MVFAGAAGFGGMIVLVFSLVAGADTGQPRFGRTPPELCSDYALRAGVQLPEQPELYRINNPSASWGTAEMIEAIVYASEEMAWQLPEADPILIGDISRPRGGHLPPHASHQGGMDADIGLFSQNAAQPEDRRFVALTPETIDYEANWLFWSSLLDTGLVERILLDQSLIDAMRAWAIESETLTPKEAHDLFPSRDTPGLWTRGGVFQHQPRHRDHIHLRVRCGLPDGAS